MKRRLLWELLVLILTMSIACADTYILHKPTQQQLQEAEALEVAKDFLYELTGVEITGIFKVVDGKKTKGKALSYFGPGYQWGADTNDDCWVLDIRNESVVERPWIVIHGTTGEILYWKYTDKITNCTYINRIPSEEHLSQNEAVEIAYGGFEHAIDEPFSIGYDGIYLDSCYGTADVWNTDIVNIGTAPVWYISISSEQYGYTVYIDAESGDILDEQLLKNGAIVSYGAFQQFA